MTGRAQGASAPRVTPVRASVFLGRVAPAVRGQAASGWLPRGAPVPRNVTKLRREPSPPKARRACPGPNQAPSDHHPGPDLQPLTSVGLAWEGDRWHRPAVPARAQRTRSPRRRRAGAPARGRENAGPGQLPRRLPPSSFSRRGPAFQGRPPPMACALPDVAVVALTARRTAAGAPMPPTSHSASPRVVLYLIAHELYSKPTAQFIAMPSCCIGPRRAPRPSGPWAAELGEGRAATADR